MLEKLHAKLCIESFFSGTHIEACRLRSEKRRVEKASQELKKAREW